MKLTVTLEHRFQRTPDGAVWTGTAFAYAFWRRYLRGFERVRVVARVHEVAQVAADAKRADGEGVEVYAVPAYVGPLQYLRRSRQVKRAVRAAVEDAEAVILRVPSTLGGIAARALRRRGAAYAVEVVGDPYEVFAPGAVRHPLSPLLRRTSPRSLRRRCRHAAAGAYVTRTVLQQRYPCGGPSLGVSDVELPPAAFVPQPRTYARAPSPLRLVTVGSLEQLYKGTDVLIDAVAACVRGGMDLRLTIVGDGRHRGELEARAARASLQAHVTFAGQLSGGERVRACLDAADVFVLPSRTEGLPRALLEAMARALPCLGSRVGGIPELLAEEDLVPPGDAEALAARFAACGSDPAWLARSSARNLEVARTYRDEALSALRDEFLALVAASALSPRANGSRLQRASTS
ncbi:glycosyltransferase family 4 protein [Aggregicoccus sp. 17bor-14]|uniref:glycosyltransferase n=1 Tax=Myxococcaceae TaxID=31 RepID=UPI00129C36E5|nr:MULTISPECIES: glycosyltransferase [Myxococcaceae]MBF5043464.1 glycosyltransferase family 4 protein [Simulacricoccus sp. 17bor-14]MRI89222.1 glycosyltransferase family 4 protein [Aggregicoccus sp. 17bor-14]